MAAGDPAHPHLHPGCPPQNSRRVREIKTPRQQTRRDRAQALATGQKAVGRQQRVHGRPQAAARQGGAHAGRRRHQQRDQGGLHDRLKCPMFDVQLPGSCWSGQRGRNQHGQGGAGGYRSRRPAHVRRRRADQIRPVGQRRL